jgi:hypothetical protein
MELQSHYLCPLPAGFGTGALEIASSKAKQLRSQAHWSLKQASLRWRSIALAAAL